MTQAELDEIIGKLKQALQRREIVEHCRVGRGRILTEDSSLLINDEDYSYTIRRKPIACVYVEETEAPGDG